MVHFEIDDPVAAILVVLCGHKINTTEKIAADAAVVAVVNADDSFAKDVGGLGTKNAGIRSTPEEDLNSVAMDGRRLDWSRRVDGLRSRAMEGTPGESTRQRMQVLLAERVRA